MEAERGVKKMRGFSQDARIQGNDAAKDTRLELHAMMKLEEVSRTREACLSLLRLLP